MTGTSAVGLIVAAAGWAGGWLPAHSCYWHTTTPVPTKSHAGTEKQIREQIVIRRTDAGRTILRLQPLHCLSSQQLQYAAWLLVVVLYTRPHTHAPHIKGACIIAPRLVH